MSYRIEFRISNDEKQNVLKQCRAEGKTITQFFKDKMPTSSTEKFMLTEKQKQYRTGVKIMKEENHHIYTLRNARRSILDFTYDDYKCHRPFNHAWVKHFGKRYLQLYKLLSPTEKKLTAPEYQEIKGIMQDPEAAENWCKAGFVDMQKKELLGKYLSKRYGN